jgi:hypothetical protein
MNGISSLLLRPCPNIPPPYCNAEETSELLKAECRKFHYLPHPKASLNLSPREQLLATADEFESSFTCSEDLELFKHFISFVVESGSDPYGAALATADKFLADLKCADNCVLFNEFVDICAQKVHERQNVLLPHRKCIKKINSGEFKSELEVLIVLRRMDVYMRQHHIRCIDLFRQRNFNLSYDQGDNKLDRNEFKNMLLQMGMCLNHHEVQLLVDYLDCNDDGEVDIEELDMVMKHARREVKGFSELTSRGKWEERVPQRPMSSKATRAAVTRPVTAGGRLFSSLLQAYSTLIPPLPQ